MNDSMNAPETGHPILRLLLRNYVELLTMLVMLFVLQSGLVPFDFAELPPGPTARTFFGAAVSRLTLPDTVSNIFLYFPVGLLMHWSLCRAVCNPTLALLVTLILSAGLSAGIEWAQAYSATRVSSMIDLAANVTGAAVGCFVAWTGRAITPRIEQGALLELRRRPQALFLKAYCGVLVIFAAMPFSFSFDVMSLRKAARSANFTPFAVADASDPLHDLARKTTADHNAAAYLAWAKMKRYSRWAAEAVSFAVLAWLLHQALRRDYGFRGYAAALLVWYLGGVFAVALSAMQLAVISRACDVTDVVFRLIGMGIGLTARAVFRRRAEDRTATTRASNSRKLEAIGVAGVTAYIVYTGLIPFTFEVNGERVASALTSPGFLPFFAYFTTRFDLMMSDAAEKFASYLLFAVLLASLWDRAGDGDARPCLVKVLLVGLALSTAIEIVQLLNPVRVPSLTDPILAGAACVAGVLGQQLAAHFYRQATSPTTLAADDAGRAARSGRVTPSDTLVATLLEPHPGAPVEMPSVGSSKKRP